MIGENQHLVTDEPFEVGDFRRITDHFRGIYKIYPNSMKQNRRMSTCNWLDLQILGSQPVMPKNLPDHWLRPRAKGNLANPIGCELKANPKSFRPGVKANNSLNFNL